MLAALLVTAIQPINLDQTCQQAFALAQAKFADKKVLSQEVAITVMEADGKSWRTGGMNQDRPFYPASVVKLFWLAYAHHAVKDWSEEDLRAARDMIVESNNDATGYIVNLATGALPGPELKGQAYQEWTHQRQAANRWFKGLGYEGINVLNRTYNEGPYGREAQIIKELGRNSLTTRATARLMSQFSLDEFEPKRSIAFLRAFLRRDPMGDDEQVKGYLGGIMPKGTEHWSKAGWTSDAKHDVALDVMPDGRRFVFCVFTTRPTCEGLVPTIGAELIRLLGYQPRR